MRNWDIITLKVGKQKFLEQPFLENEKKYIDKIKENIPDEVLK